MAYFYLTVLSLVWLAWAIYWIASIVYESTTSKAKETQRRVLGTGFLFLILLLVMLSPTTLSSPLGWLYFVPLQVLKAVGLVITTIGVLFAIWARWHLGAWSGIPSLKKGHALITSGPYSVVRHPIYMGIMFGMVGSTLVLGTLGSLVVIFLSGVVIAIRIRQEEGLMMSQFEDSYSDYRKKPKSIIPWIF